MATVQQILNDINLRYRNTFTTDQLLVWLNEEQRELLDVLEIDGPPYSFVTVLGQPYYPFPAGMDLTKIKVVTMQIDTTSPEPTYIELPFRRNDDNVYAPHNPWYTVISGAMYIWYPGGVPDAMNVYIYADADPADITSSSQVPDLPTKYQEILKLGVLKRIAGARKDIQMRNSYDAEYQEKISDVMLQRKLQEPEWISPIDVMPRVGRGWRQNVRAVAITTFQSQ